MNKQLERLEYLASLEEDWDGNDACKIDTTIIEFVKGIAEHLDKWHIFPSINGTLLLDLKGDQPCAGISFGADEYSYAAFTLENNKVRTISKGIKKRNKENIVETIEEIERY